MPKFERYLGIDYSGAETPTSSLKGIRVYSATRESEAREVPPPPSPRKYWTRRGLAHWLGEELAEGPPTLVGIDHAFSFPIRYFETHWIPPDWPAFLEDFHRHWPTDKDNTYVDFIRDGISGEGAARSGSSKWRRRVDIRAGAKSPFHFDVPGSVAKSTHAGLPWLLYLRRELDERLHFWPFDGWSCPPGKSMIAEVYPSLWKHEFPRQERTADQHDAYCAASWMQRADRDGTLDPFLSPDLDTQDEGLATVEGWILGVRRESQED